MPVTPTIYIVENHHEIYYLWRQLKFNHIKLLHFDAHCDMHGLLVDRNKSHAFILPGLKNIDCGNFITFAVREGIVDEIKWVHDEYGGRNRDITHVKYTTDLTAIPFLCKAFFLQQTRYPLKYKEQNHNNIRQISLEKNEYLDIDWDFFALKTKTPIEQKKSINSFLSLGFHTIPDYTFVSYSKDYVSSTRQEFNDFIIQLKRMFRADVVEYAYPFPKEQKDFFFIARCINSIRWRFRKYIYVPIKKAMNRFGIY